VLDVQPVSHALEDKRALVRLQCLRAAATAPTAAVAGSAAASATPCAAACAAAAAAAAARRRASALLADLHHFRDRAPVSVVVSSGR